MRKFDLDSKMRIDKSSNNKNAINKKKIYRSAIALTMVAAITSTYSVYDATYSAENNKADGAISNSTITATKMPLKGFSDTKDVEEKLEDAVKSAVKVDSKSKDKEETVYVVTDSNGKTQKIIVSDKINAHGKTGVIKDKSDLEDIRNIEGEEKIDVDGYNLDIEADGKDVYYQGKSTKQLPVTVKIRYFLDGKEMTSDEIAGKSGKVTIRYEYKNNQKTAINIDGEEEEVYVPFVVATGMILNSKFNNIEAENAKVMSEGNKTIVVGMAMPGLKESLNVTEDDLDGFDIPDSFEVTADVEDFSTDMSLTVISNDLGIEADKIDLTNVNDKIDELDESATKLSDGATKLSDGIGTLDDKLDPFKNGMYSLKDGIKGYTKGAGQLSDGIGQLNKSVPTLASGVSDLKKGVNAIYDNFGNKDDKNTLIGGIGELESGAAALSSGAGEAETGSGALYSGAGSLAKGIASLDTGAGKISGGLAQLNQGLVSVDSGVNAIKTGLEQLTTKGTLPLSMGATAVNDGVQKLVGSISMMEQSLDNKSEEILTKLQGLGINSVEEAKTAKENAQTLQAALVSAIATNDYSNLQAYGVTDAQSAATMLVTVNGKVDALTEAITALDTMGKISGQFAGKEEELSQLSEGAKELATGAYEVNLGATELESGAIELAKGTKSTVDGSAELCTGAAELESGAGTLSAGATELESGAKTLNDGLKTLSKGAGSLSKGTTKYKKGLNTLYTKAVSPVNNGINTLNGKVPTLKKGVRKLWKGSRKLVSNNKKINSGAKDLYKGANKISDGVKQLDDGANQLASGMSEFNSKAIDKLVDAYKGDVESFVRRLNALIDANDNYSIYSDAEEGMSTSVKFIVKSEGVSK